MVAITVSKSSPTVTFTVEAVYSSTNIGGNYSQVAVRAAASKASGSYFNGDGVEVASIDGVGEAGRHSAKPFLPSGSTGWNDGWWYLNVGHDGNGNCNATIRMTLVYGNVNEAHTTVLSLPSIPQTPYSLAASRVSDTRVDLSWARAGATSFVVVQRSTDDGPWQQVGAPAGNITTYSDTTASAGHKYVYRVQGAINGVGYSAWSGSSAPVYTSPAAPTGASAARSGMDIVVSASTVPPYATGFDVMDGATVVASGVSLPWTHVAPTASVPHQYQVRAVVPGPVAGAWSSPSNVVQLIAPPAAPTGLAPNGGVAASDEDVTFSWVHNPVDASAQTAFEVQHRVPGGAWTTISGTTASQVTATLPVGDREWQVRTKGTDPAFGPWSAVAVVTVITRPGVAVTQPDTTWEASVLTVGWSWFQPEGRPQSSWRLELLDATGQTVESQSGSGATASFTVVKRLTPGDWTVRVQAATGDVWSIWASETFTVVFDPPAPPLLDGSWSEETGVVTLTVAAGGVVGPVDVDALVQDDRWVLWDAVPDESTAAVVEPVPPASVRLLVERLDGTTWTKVTDGPAGATFTDAASPSFGDIVYRATAFTAEGAVAVTEIIVAARSTALWLSGGPGFMTTARLPMSPDVSPASGLARALKFYAGRDVPVAFDGEMTSLSWQVSGMVTDRTFIEPTATPDEMLAMGRSKGLFLFRDPDGRRLIGSIGEIQLQRQATTSITDPLRNWNAFWGFGFTITEATGV